MDYSDVLIRNSRTSGLEVNANDVDDIPDDSDSLVGVDHSRLNIDPNPSTSYSHPETAERNSIQLPDMNTYQQKKTLAKGMMDLALLSANANQLRYVLESYKRHPYFYPSIIFISLSIIFQVAVGVGLILNSRYNINVENDRDNANKVNNYTVIGIFIITVVNVFVSVFGVADAPV